MPAGAPAVQTRGLPLRKLPERRRPVTNHGDRRQRRRHPKRDKTHELLLRKEMRRDQQRQRRKRRNDLHLLRRSNTRPEFSRKRFIERRHNQVARNQNNPSDHMDARKRAAYDQPQHGSKRQQAIADQITQESAKSA